MSDESATATAAPTPERCLYLIHCLDDISGEMIEKGTRFGGSAKRLGVYLEHRAYLATTNDPASPNYIKKVAAGPMESEDQKYMIGSFFIVESTREEAEAFNRNDPFRINNVWDKVTITRWVSIPNGILPVDCVMDGDDLSTVKMVVRSKI